MKNKDIYHITNIEGKNIGVFISAANWKKIKKKLTDLEPTKSTEVKEHIEDYTIIPQETAKKSSVIKISPKNKKQDLLLKAILQEMNIDFEALDKDFSLMSEKEFFDKIDLAVSQAEKGETLILSEENQKEFLGL